MVLFELVDGQGFKQIILEDFWKKKISGENILIALSEQTLNVKMLFSQGIAHENPPALTIVYLVEG